MASSQGIMRPRYMIAIQRPNEDAAMTLAALGASSPGPRTFTTLCTGLRQKYAAFAPASATKSIFNWKGRFTSKPRVP